MSAGIDEMQERQMPNCAPAERCNGEKMKGDSAPPKKRASCPHSGFKVFTAHGIAVRVAETR